MPLQKVPNSDGTQSDYQDDPSQVTLALGDMLNLHDYQQTAEPGRWFYGVVDTISGKMYLVAGDVHDDPKNALQQNDRMKNTYASKPNAPDVGWKSLQPLGDPQQTEGIKGEPTGHNSVAKLYKLDVGQCLGFRLIMINGAFASFSDRSNSMNANKPDQRMVSVHPKGTNPATIPAVPGVTHLVTSSAGYTPSGTARMPPTWATAVQNFLKAKLGITNLAVDF